MGNIKFVLIGIGLFFGVISTASVCNTSAAEVNAEVSQASSVPNQNCARPEVSRARIVPSPKSPEPEVAQARSFTSQKVPEP